MRLYKPNTIKRVLNLWPPFWGAGISVQEISPDWNYVKVTMKLRWYNKNYVGAHYGGSLYSMTDPFYMLMFINLLGKDYIVWDKAAEIDYKSPGRGQVFAEFNISQKQLDDLKQQVEQVGKITPVFPIQIVDKDGQLIARVNKTIYIRKKGFQKESS